MHKPHPRPNFTPADVLFLRENHVKTDFEGERLNLVDELMRGPSSEAEALYEAQIQYEMPTSMAKQRDEAQREADQVGNWFAWHVIVDLLIVAFLVLALIRGWRF
jgi:hypothetical protein